MTHTVQLLTGMTRTTVQFGARKISEFHLACWASNSQVLLVRGTSPLAQGFKLINNSWTRFNHLTQMVFNSLNVHLHLVCNVPPRNHIEEKCKKFKTSRIITSRLPTSVLTQAQCLPGLLPVGQARRQSYLPYLSRTTGRGLFRALNSISWVLPNVCHVLFLVPWFLWPDPDMGKLSLHI